MYLYRNLTTASWPNQRCFLIKIKLSLLTTLLIIMFLRIKFFSTLPNKLLIPVLKKFLIKTIKLICLVCQSLQDIIVLPRNFFTHLQHIFFICIRLQFRRKWNSIKLTYYNQYSKTCSFLLKQLKDLKETQ